MLTSELQAALADVSVDEPWALIQRFTTLRREHPDDVRTATIRGLVDTGATRLVLPAQIVQQLNFPEQGMTQVRYADHRRAERQVVSQVQVYLLGRTGSFTAVVEPDREDALIGAFVLEELDLLVDPRLGRLIPRDPDTTLTEIE